MDISWNQVDEEYNAIIANLSAVGKKSAVLGMNELKEKLPACFPEAENNPVVLSETPWNALYMKFRTMDERGKDNSFSTHLYVCLKRVRKILSRLVELTNLPKERLKVGLTKLQILSFFRTWLESQGWENIRLMIAKKNAPDIQGYKDGLKLGAVVIHASGHRNTSLRNLTSHSVFRLLDLKISDPEYQLALVVTDDNETRRRLIPYALFILRTGIRVFMLQDEKQVEELTLNDGVQDYKMEMWNQ